MSDSLLYVAAAAAVAGVVSCSNAQRKSKAAKAAAAAAAAASAATVPRPAVAEGKAVEEKKANDEFYLRHDYSGAHFGTRAIHVGQEPDKVTGAVAVPISLASTFAQDSPGVMHVRQPLYSQRSSSLWLTSFPRACCVR